MILKAEKVSRKFSRKNGTANYFYALEENDFVLNPGELTVITGRSGSGKTTLMNLMGGLLKPSSGKVLLDDKDIYALSDSKLSMLRNTAISIIPQGAGAIYTLSVFDNILLPVMMFGKRVPEDECRAEELMRRLDIDQLRDAMPAELSGGELRRMAIARALVNRPSFILADEPTGDLDDENTQTVLEILKETAGQDAAVMIISHDRETVSYADRIYRMNSGRLSEERFTG